MSILRTHEKWSKNTYENSSCKNDNFKCIHCNYITLKKDNLQTHKTTVHAKLAFYNATNVVIIRYLKNILKRIKQQSIVKIVFLNARSVINKCCECDDLKKAH